ncbi:protein disulfide oxidoreductase [Lentzea sp. NPDC051838]|uniref:protein disulfide oxidoreductase n=1 Tax=Lentzea sp. NPDC051838 TaxID=3154849 RepID=UPI003412A05B
MATPRVPAMAFVLALFATACGAQPSSAPTTPPATTTTTAASSPSSTSAQPTAEVPEQLKFTAKTVDGTNFDGASLAGRPAVLWFWAPWCPKCQREAPGMAKAAKDLGASVTFLGVAALDQVPAMQGFVAKYDLKSFQHIADTESAVWKRFGVTAQPAYAFVDKNGKVDVVTTQLSEQDLRDRLSKLT